MTYPQIDNWIIILYPQTLLKSDLRVKIYSHFSKGLSNRLSRQTQRRGVGETTDYQSWPSFGPTTTFSGVCWPFPLQLNPKLCRFDPKSSDFSKFKLRNIIKTYLSQIIKSKHRKLEAREEKNPRILVQERHKLQQFQPRNLSIFPWISSPGMWDFTSGFLSPIGSLVSVSSWFSYHD